jgi:radical SAM superfamily enzyme YgiQ (UPF0313 family)
MLLDALADRGIKFGVQMRIDLWNEDMLRLLGRAGCVSIEAGVECVSEEGRSALKKGCRIPLSSITERLIFAKRHVPFVQANLMQSGEDDPNVVEEWRKLLKAKGVWANKPVPIFPYPGSSLYREKWGNPDDLAWERAHEYYLNIHKQFSDIQDQEPLSLEQLELRVI